VWNAFRSCNSIRSTFHEIAVSRNATGSASKRHHSYSAIFSEFRKQILLEVRNTTTRCCRVLLSLRRTAKVTSLVSNLSASLRGKKRRQGISPSAAAIVVVVVISVSAVGIVELQTSSTLKVVGDTQTIVVTSTLTNVSTSTVTVTSVQQQQSVQTTPCCESTYAQLSVTGTSLNAADFAAGAAGDITCVTSGPASPYITLTNTGTASATVTSITITWAGANSGFDLHAATTCSVGAAGSASATTFAQFTTTPKLAEPPVVGQTYSGIVTLSNGAQILFTGIWH